MTRVTKNDWLEEGLTVLEQLGVAGLTLETLTQRLGVTTGSFYHHFKNQPDYQTQLLAYWEEAATQAVIRASEAEPTPEAVFHRIMALSLARPSDPETALRLWATQNPEVREAVARVDHQRLSYGDTLFAAIVGDAHRGRVLTRLLYAILIGSRQMLPPLGNDALEELIHEFERLLTRSGENNDAVAE